MKYWSFLLVMLLSSVVAAEDAYPVPLTRPEMKVALDRVKERKPRIPLPELTADEAAKLGERERSYESRLRSLYLAEFNDGRATFGLGGGGPAGTSINRDADPELTLSYAFKVKLFWVVSRTNNCLYCLGHQENKLLAAGLKEDEIAALDSDWATAEPKEKAALAFARKYTLAPHELNAADIHGLKEYFSELQILEMILSMAGNNAINRWKEGVAVPQSASGGGFGARGGAAPPPEKAHTYVTPTAELYRTPISRVAPYALDANGKPITKTLSQRPPLEGRTEVEKQLLATELRQPRLPLVSEKQARELVPSDFPKESLPQWVRLLANFRNQGKSRIASQWSAQTSGSLSPVLKAQVRWIVARHDRAWYATGLAYRDLLALGQSPEQIFALDGDWSKFSAKDRAMLTVARNLASSPVVLSDDEVAAAVKECGPRDVTQLVHIVTVQASFDRITESAGLALESKTAK